MVEDDTFTYHVKQLAANKINAANTAVPSLITKERMQKLDLLIHLLSNLTQALVVCGPEGIGKTTLLKVLQSRKTESWRYCLIQGNADLSFEAVLQQLAKPGQSLTTALDQHKQVVLVVDNAGELVPGLIATIIQYAAANPVLRVVFALTHDELQVKRGSDRAVDDCHIVEIPPLSEKQCGDFLQHLSTKPSANVTFKAIGENMIAHIYRETHGVPGRIIAEVSGLSDAKQGGKLKWVLIAVAAAVAIAIGFQWLLSSAIAPGIALPPASMQSSKNNVKNAIAPASVERNADNAEAVSPRPESQIILTLPPAQSVIQPQQSEPANEAKEGAEPSVEVNASGDSLHPAVTSVSPKTPNFGAQPSAASALPLPLEAHQEKSERPVNNVEGAVPENSEIKVQSGPVSTIGVEQKQDNKQLGAASQKIAASPEASREKPKQAELGKTVDRVEPFTANNLETIQIPPKPVDVAAVPEQRVTEAAEPQHLESGGATTLSANNFTLQLMVLSKQSSVNDILKKYPAMESGLRVIKMVVNGKEKFILEYGSYPDAVSANKARQSLPFEFRDALARKISSVKQR